MIQLFAIRLPDAGGVFMNQHGDWGDETLARLFDDKGRARAFLDLKNERMKRSMKGRAEVVAISAEDLARMTEGAAEALSAARKHGAAQDVFEWSATFNRLFALFQHPTERPR